MCRYRQVAGLRKWCASSTITIPRFVSGRRPRLAASCEAITILRPSAPAVAFHCARSVAGARQTGGRWGSSTVATASATYVLPLPTGSARRRLHAPDRMQRPPKASNLLGRSHLGAASRASSGASRRAIARATSGPVRHSPGRSAVTMGSGTGASASATILGTFCQRADEGAAVDLTEREVSGGDVIEVLLHAAPAGGEAGDGGEIGVRERALRQW